MDIPVMEYIAATFEAIRESCGETYSITGMSMGHDLVHVLQLGALG